MEKCTRHPQDPPSNVNKFGGYDPDKYTIDNVSLTVKTHEDLTPGRPPCLTQMTIGKFLQPLTRELVEVPPSLCRQPLEGADLAVVHGTEPLIFIAPNRPMIDELPDMVIDKMVARDKAFWVDKPGANAYTLHDAYYNYGLTTVVVKPPHQDVFPRSYQYDLDCVKYRRLHACDGLKQPEGQRTKLVSAHCRDCRKLNVPGLTPFQLAWAQDPGQKRWKYYPDLSATLSYEEIKTLMNDYGRPYKNEAINWYYENFPPVKYNTIMRKFAK